MAVLESAANEASSGENTKNMPESSKTKPKMRAELIRLARKCADSNRALRDKALKTIRNLLHSPSHSSGLTEESFFIIWKGLFYSMWMTEPDHQENCARNITYLLHWVLDVPTGLTFFKCGLRTLMNEWFGLDHFRVNKFMMLTRQLLRQTFVLMKRKGYQTEHLNLFGDIILEILKPKDLKAIGLSMHFTSIYLEELAKVSKGQLKPAAFNILILPCVKALATVSDPRMATSLKINVFSHLIRQSKLAQKYEEKYEAWRSMGFPGTIDQMVKVDVDEESEEEQSSSEEARGDCGKKKKATKRKWEDEDEEEEDEQNLDPRAGRVDVVLPQIKFNAQALIALLNQHKFDQGSTSKSRKHVSLMIEHLEKYSKGIYPFATRKVREDYRDAADNVRKAVNRMVKFEKKIATAGSEALKKKKKKKGKRAAENIEVESQEEQQYEEEDEEYVDSDGSGSGKKMRFDDDDDEEQELQPLEQEEQTEFAEAVAIQVPRRKRKAESNGRSSSSSSSSSNEESSSPPKVPKKRQETFIESVFKRNSGMWIVTHGEGQASTSNPPAESRKRSKPKKAVRPKIPKPASGYIQLFPASEWDQPIEEGEYEIFIPHKKPANTGASTSTSADVDDMAAALETSMKLTASPLGTHKVSPNKKVKFNTSLNTSQELEEHEYQVYSSPAIPFDSKKKPTKPLLKKRFVNNVVNPWYRHYSMDEDDDS